MSMCPYFTSPDSFLDEFFAPRSRGFCVRTTPPVQSVQSIYSVPMLGRAVRINPEFGKEISSNEKNLGKDGFEAKIDVNHFQSNEISVTTVENSIIVEGKHEERDDAYGSVERHFIRKYYFLPNEVDINSVYSTLSNDGILMVRAPLLTNLNAPKQIPITKLNISASEASIHVHQPPIKSSVHVQQPRSSSASRSSPKPPTSTTPGKSPVTQKSPNLTVPQK